MAEDVEEKYPEAVIKDKDGIKMGTGKGYLFVPDQIYSDLKERWENGRNAPVVIPINNDIIEK